MSTTEFQSVSFVETAGAPLDEARGAMILIHGRGGSAGEMIALHRLLPRIDFAYLAPQQRNHSWYPLSFLAPLEQNEPGISRGLATIDSLIDTIGAAGIDRPRVVLAGFSQGACLVSEYAARNATRYGGLVLFSGGLIGPRETTRDYEGSFEGTPVFIGCNDDDPHIPAWRVTETASVLTQMDAVVEAVLYSGEVRAIEKHTIVKDELVRAKRLVDGVVV